MEKLKEKLFEELDKIDRKDELNPGDLELAHKLSDTIKNLDKICLLEEEGGYSQEGEYGNGSSYANRGKHYVRGHYSREGGSSYGGGQGGSGGYSSRRGGGSRNGYSHNGGYSREGGRSGMMEHLEMAMDSATDQDRETIKRFMRQLENA